MDDDGGEGDLEVEGREAKWKNTIEANVANLISQRSRRRRDWMTLIYGTNLTPEEILTGKITREGAEEEDEEDELFTFRTKEGVRGLEVLDQTKELVNQDELNRWEDEEMLDSIRHLFITGGVQEEEDMGNNGSEGGFEDLEAGSAPKEEAKGAEDPEE